MNYKRHVNGNTVDADNFALNLRAIRRRKEIKSCDFAKMVNMSERRLVSVENGKAAIRLDEALDVCDALNMDFFVMLKGVIQDVE